MKTFCGLTTDGMLDYLATIYKLSQQSEKVTTGAIAERMHVSAAAASSMLKRLDDADLIERSNADGISLTEQGRLAALQLIRRHRLLEVFLMKVMGMSWDQVDVEAHRLEHAISAAFEDRMDELCNYPTRCPHGDPIPAPDGSMPADPSIALPELPLGHRAVLRRVATDDPRILRYLSRLGLMPGQTIQMIDVAPFNGPVSLDRVMSSPNSGRPQERDRQILGRELANLLFVEPQTQPHATPQAV